VAEETAAIRAVRRTDCVNNRHRFQLKFVQKPAIPRAGFLFLIPANTLARYTTLFALPGYIL
jgi:hypothetical protein